MRPSYLYKWNPYTGKTASLYSDDPLVTHIGISELSQHWSMLWLEIGTTTLSIQENASENVFCKMAAIFPSLNVLPSNSQFPKMKYSHLQNWRYIMLVDNKHIYRTLKKNSHTSKRNGNHGSDSIQRSASRDSEYHGDKQLQKFLIRISPLIPGFYDLQCVFIACCTSIKIITFAWYSWVKKHSPN